MKLQTFCFVLLAHHTSLGFLHIHHYTVPYANVLQLGGALTDKASWRWCFWVRSTNIPRGIIFLWITRV